MAYRKTKIICTIGPATNTLEKIRALAEAGMGIARINMSHGDQKGHLEVIKRIKSYNKTAAMPIAILLDTQGPEIRTGDVLQNFTLTVGDMIEITAGSENTENNSVITVNYRDMLKDLKPGDRVTLDNGIINLDVVHKTDFGLMCKVVDGGLVKSRRHINLPGIRVNLPSITAKDVQDIMFGVKNDVDFIALSFVRTAADVEDLDLWDVDERVGRHQLRCTDHLAVGGAQQIGDEPGDPLHAVGKQHVEAAGPTVRVPGFQDTAHHRAR